MKASEECKRVGANVRLHRIRMGLRQDKLAARVGLSRTSVVNLEAGNQNVTLNKLVAYASALGVDITDLTGRMDTVCIEVIVTGVAVQNKLPAEIMKALKDWTLQELGR